MTGVQTCALPICFPVTIRLIFNEWFRDENLVTSFIVDTGDGPDPSSYYSILNRGKRHDILLFVCLGRRRALPLIFLWAPRLL